MKGSSEVIEGIVVPVISQRGIGVVQIEVIEGSVEAVWVIVSAVGVWVIVAVIAVVVGQPERSQFQVSQQLEVYQSASTAGCQLGFSLGKSCACLRKSRTLFFGLFLFSGPRGLEFLLLLVSFVLQHGFEVFVGFDQVTSEHVSLVLKVQSFLSIQTVSLHLVVDFPQSITHLLDLLLDLLQICLHVFSWRLLNDFMSGLLLSFISWFPVAGSIFLGCRFLLLNHNFLACRRGGVLSYPGASRVRKIVGLHKIYFRSSRQ